jgi:hypothetical protein
MIALCEFLARQRSLRLALPAPDSQLGSKTKTELAPSGCYAQHNLPALMRRTSKHLVSNASFLQREHSSYMRNQFSAVEKFCNLVQPCSSYIHIEVCCSNAITFLRRFGNWR